MHTMSTHKNMMNAGKVLIGMALLVLSVALMITPSRAAPLEAFPPVGSGNASYAGSIITIPPSFTLTHPGRACSHSTTCTTSPACCSIDWVYAPLPTTEG